MGRIHPNLVSRPVLFILHKIKEGERLDNIAFQYWGDTNLTSLLMFDNHHLPGVRDIEPGTIIFVRDTIDDETLTNLQDLPPWR